MPSTPSCSVVIPVLNDAGALQRCLDALDLQELQPDEVIVVDNGSADSSVAVARRAGAALLHESTPGIGAAAARGYDEASGDLILRLDADSVAPPDWTWRVVARFAADPDLDALTDPGAFTAVPDLTSDAQHHGAKTRLAEAPLHDDLEADRRS